MIAQINIVVDGKEDIVQGYNNVPVGDVSSITNGYVQNITLTTLDKIEANNRTPVFIECLKKLTIGGQITVKFLNLMLLASRIKSNYIDGNKFSEIIYGSKSFWTESDFMEIMAGIRDYKIIKIISEDLNTIAVIEKNK
jgi:hypothetical protein